MTTAFPHRRAMTGLSPASRDRLRALLARYGQDRLRVMLHASKDTLVNAQGGGLLLDDTVRRLEAAIEAVEEP